NEAKLSHASSPVGVSHSLRCSNSAVSSAGGSAPNTMMSSPARDPMNSALPLSIRAKCSRPRCPGQSTEAGHCTARAAVAPATSPVEASRAMPNTRLEIRRLNRFESVLPIQYSAQLLPWQRSPTLSAAGGAAGRAAADRSGALVAAAAEQLKAVLAEHPHEDQVDDDGRARVQRHHEGAKDLRCRVHLVVDDGREGADEVVEGVKGEADHEHGGDHDGGLGELSGGIALLAVAGGGGPGGGADHDDDLGVHDHHGAHGAHVDAEEPKRGVDGQELDKSRRVEGRRAVFADAIGVADPEGDGCSQQVGAQVDAEDHEGHVDWLLGLVLDREHHRHEALHADEQEVPHAEDNEDPVEGLGVPQVAGHRVAGAVRQVGQQVEHVQQADQRVQAGLMLQQHQRHHLLEALVKNTTRPRMFSIRPMMTIASWNFLKVLIHSGSPVAATGAVVIVVLAEGEASSHNDRPAAEGELRSPAANETQNRAAESRASNDLSCFASSVPAFSFLHLAIAPPLAPMSYRSATDLLTEPGSSRAPECLTLSSSGSAGGCSRFGRCGLSDIQRHSSGGHRTTVITRLTSEMATSGGILDANFVIDTQSSNTELSPGSQDSADSSPDASSGSDNWRIGHLQKEGSVIGCMNVFADVMKREFVVLMTDSVIEAFLIEPSQFRAIARRTGCEIEVTRRILNRRVGAHRWVKYLVLTIKGPTCTAIDQCDRLMVKVFPPYKVRKEYLEPAPVALFVKESYPDNTQLYFNFQRTGATADRLGDMRLQTPFGPDPYRPLENTPWKYADWRLFRGMLEPRNLAVEHTIQHVYPEWGTEVSNSVEPEHKWELAGDYALDLEKRMALERSVRVKNRKLEAEPLFAENT
uniref:L51_S25_CI-B8 domain-containing protein n=1 Tax=Macrostomum lignano TaxID=282301 RepID=A0A1I8IXZ1_9PLAT